MTEEFIPTDLVKKFSSRGLTEGEIILELRNRGFTPKQIDKALKVAIKEEVHRRPAPVPNENREYREERRGRPHPAPMPKNIEMEEPENVDIPEHLRPMHMPEPDKEHVPSHARVPRMPTGDEPEDEKSEDVAVPVPEHHAPSSPVVHVGDVSVEELVEAVVEEQMRDVESRLDGMEKKVADIESQPSYKRKEDKHSAEMEKKVVGHLNDLKDAISDLESRTHALEKAFKDLAKHVKK